MITSYVGTVFTLHIMAMAGLRVIMIMLAMVILGVLMIRPLAALQRVLEYQLTASVINSYDGVGIVGENRALLDGGSNIGRSGTHEGKNNDATKSSKLHERVSCPWS